MSHPAPPIIIADADKEALISIAQSPTSKRRAVIRARIVLYSAEGLPLGRIASNLGVSVNTVKRWRERFTSNGVAGLVDAPRPGRSAAYASVKRSRVLPFSQTDPPPDRTLG